MVVILIFGPASKTQAQTLTNANLEELIRNLIQVVERLQTQLREERSLFDVVRAAQQVPVPTYADYVDESVEVIKHEDAVTDRIATSDLIVVSPRNNAVWNRGAKYAINWSMVSLKSPEIRIINKETGRIAYSIKMGRSSTRYVWSVPLDLPVGVYMIQITATDIQTGDLYLSQSHSVIVIEEDLVPDSGYDVAL